MKLLLAGVCSVVLFVGGMVQAAQDTTTSAVASDGQKAAADKAKTQPEKAEAHQEVKKVEDLVKQADKATEAPAVPLEKDTLAKRAGYSLGVIIGKQLKMQKIDLNADTFARGFQDSFQGKELVLTDEQIQAAMTELQQIAQQQENEHAKVEGDKNKAEGQAFLEKNKKEEGVITTASGLQYKIIKQGQGAAPQPDDIVQVHYVGKLLNGQEFDSSYKRNQPASFPVNGVIAGWTEALQLMKPGAKFRLFIPASLAYGEHGAGDMIGPNATLVFDVELLAVQPKNAK